MEMLSPKIKQSLSRIVRGILFRAYCIVDYAKCHVYYCVIHMTKKKEYRKLEQLKNKHAGERVFLIGTGPSLKLDNVKKLRGEYTFALNSFAKGVQALGFEPSFYGFTDVEVLNDFWGEEILNLEQSLVFFPSRLRYHTQKKKALSDKGNSFEYPMLDVGQWGNFAKKVPAGFSEDITKTVYFGYTCAYAMMQIIVYMGFKEVYLLGMDCSYKPGKANFMDSRKEEDIAKGSQAGDYFLIAWKKVKEYCDKENIKIYNVSREGNLDMFPRVDMEDIELG